VIIGELQGNKLDLAPETQGHIWGFVDGKKLNSGMTNSTTFLVK
jgi:hypothetical protein